MNTLFSLLMLCVIPAVLGCDRKAPVVGVAPSATADSPPVAPSTPREGAQRDIQVASELKNAIILDPALSDQARRCDVSCKNGIVTITGKVPLQTDKDIIGAKASAMPAAIRVENKLEVVTASL